MGPPYSDATGYQIQIDTVPTFDSAALFMRSLPARPQPQLPSGQRTRYWRIRGLPEGLLTMQWTFYVVEPIQVNTTLQSPGNAGDCTLGEAIAAANSRASVDGAKQT